VPLNKQALIDGVIAALSAELENYARSARSAHAEATDEQSKAENKYDTRGLEAGYLARGQSRQAMEVAHALEQYRALPLRSFSPTDPIDLGAVVQVELQGERTLYFLGPAAGGTEVTCEDQPVVVITPQSPLGRQLIGRQLGAEVPASARSAETCRIVAVQ
jgi:transcription elongation GreA/GreB family factor